MKHDYIIPECSELVLASETCVLTGSMEASGIEGFLLEDDSEVWL